MQWRCKQECFQFVSEHFESDVWSSQFSSETVSMTEVILQQHFDRRTSGNRKLNWTMNGTLEEERRVLYKTESLDGTKPKTNPNPNPLLS